MRRVFDEWKANRNGAKILFRRCGSMLLGFSLLYKALLKWAFVPAGRWLWGKALALTPSHFITNDNIGELLQSPATLLTALVLLLLYAVLAFWEISAILVCAESGYRGERIGFLALWKTSFCKMSRVLRPKNWPVLLVSAVILPFSNLYTASDIISELTVPEYIMEVIRTTPKYNIPFVLLSAALLLLSLRLLYLFNIFIGKNAGFMQAAKESLRLTRGKNVINLINIALWKLRCQILYGFLPFVLLLALRGVSHVLLNDPTNANVLYDYAASNYLAPFLTLVSGCLTTFSLYTYIVALYHRAQGEPAAAAAAPLPDGKKSMGLRWLLPALYTAVASASLLIFLVASAVDDFPALATSLYHPIAVTGHRGYSGVAPENTLPAFDAAIRCGCANYAELDVQQTSDGVVVVTHDSSLLRCTGKAVNVYDIPYAETQKLDAGRYFGAAFAGTKLPTLDEVIALCDGKILLNIEIKNPATSPTLVEETVRIIHAHDFAKQCVITSLDYPSLEKVKALDSSIQTGYILAVGLGCYYDLPAADFFSVASNFVSANMVDDIHARGKTVHVWTIDDEDDADEMIAAGVDNIITGDPVLVHDAIHDYAPDLDDFIQSLSGFDADLDDSLDGSFDGSPGDDAAATDLDALVEEA